jgi:hypothetical protein
MKISLFVEISRLTIKYTAWNLHRCNIVFTVWWSTYRKINACVRSQNDNNDNLDSTNVLISDVQLLLLECRRKQRRSITITRLSSRTATFNYYYSTVVESSDVQLLLLDCRREQRRSIIITRLSSRTATLKSCARRSSTIVTRLKDEYINWWRKRENDIINLGSQNSFYQPFPVLQMNEMKFQMNRFQQFRNAHLWIIYNWFEEQNSKYSDRAKKSEFNHRADRHFESSQCFEIIVFHLSDRFDEVRSQKRQIFHFNQLISKSSRWEKSSTRWECDKFDQKRWNQEK